MNTVVPGPVVPPTLASDDRPGHHSASAGHDVTTCPICRAEAPEGARFCPTCGAARDVSPNDERRVVTVMFADIVGFTTLSEHRDPEQVKRLIDGCFELLVADVTAFGGRVDKILGDGILALFGAPVAHEDDAERAVRAALKMQQTLSAHNADIGAALQMRVGINTGEVLVGALRAGGSYTAMGDVVNTASRLQGQAPPGGVLVGQATHALSNGPIRYEWFASLTPRGRETAIDAWLAKEALLRPGERVRRNATSLVGREEELGLVTAGLRYAVARRRALLIAIDGEGGVGKTRLADELIAAARSDMGVPVLEGACVAYGEANVWWPLAAALTDSLRLDDSSAGSIRRTARTWAGEAMARPDDDPEIGRLAEALVHLLGHPSALDRLDPVRAQEELAHAVVGLLATRCKQGPLLLAIADVHWADNALLGLFEHVLTDLAALPMVLLTTSRPDPDQPWPPAPGPYSTLHVRVEPLDRVASGVLASEILGAAADPATLAHLYERSGGNPLFLEELAALVADGGHPVELPDSLRALVSARLDGLSAEQRAIVDNAAVLGASGTVTGLIRFADALGQSFEWSDLDALVEAGLLTRDGRRWRFRSQSVRDVAYQTLTKAVRAQRHCGVAEFMVAVAVNASTVGGADPVTDTTVSRDEIAHHFAAAAELVAELGPVAGVRPDLMPTAVEWLINAAERAAEQNLMRAVVRMTTRGLDLVDEAHRVGVLDAWLRLVQLRAIANTELRSLGKARADLDLALEVASAHGAIDAQAEAHRVLGSVARLSGNLDGARRELTQATTLLRAVDNPARLARALRDFAFVELVGGNPGEAEGLLDEAEELTAAAGDQRGLAWVEWHRAWLSFITGAIDQAEARLARCEAAMNDLGDQGGLGWVNGLLAYVRFYQGRIDTAEALASRVLAEATDRGDEWAAGMMLALQANLALWSGRTEEALRLSDSSRGRFRRTGDGFGQLQALAPMARALAALGKSMAFSRAVEEMQSLADTHGMAGFVALIEATGAAALGEAERAARQAAVALASPGPRAGTHGEAMVTQALALAQIGSTDQAWASLREAVGAAGQWPSVLAVKALVEAARGDDVAAIDDARAALAQERATYLDRVYAGLALSLALSRSGQGTLAAQALDEAGAVAGSTGDTVAKALVSLARATLAGDVEAVSAVQTDAALSGWRHLLTSIAAVAAQP